MEFSSLLKTNEIYTVNLGGLRDRKALYLGKRYSKRTTKNHLFLFQTHNGWPSVYLCDLNPLSDAQYKNGIIHIKYSKHIKPRKLEEKYIFDNLMHKLKNQ